jgi:Family of unknown function (DUF6600)/FecR protein
MSRLAFLGSISTALVVCLAAPTPARAQDPAGEVPAHISYVDGAAVLERDGRNETAPTSMPLLAGDRVRTQAGRVEILYADGSTLHLDSSTVVDFQSDEVIRLMNGRVRLNIAGSTRSVGYRVDAPAAWVQIAMPGEYRISVLAESEVELAVLRGSAELLNDGGRTPLGAGQRAFARLGVAPSSAYVFNSAAWDSFDRWSEARRDARLGISAEYLPDTVRPYASTFVEYGSWQNVPTYGYVWYPRVRPGWRPYYYGRWTTLRPWGWTWIGSDPWAWPTHHFGRWGFSAGAWFWIPGGTWGPAWVSWAYAPGYVSWCPLGWNNRPLFSFVNVNVFGGRRYDPWHAWTVVPHRGFGRGFVNVNVINASHIDFRTRNSFVVRNTAPDFRGYAVPRSSTPIRTVVSRNGAFGGSAAFNRGPSSVGVAVPRSGGDPTAAFRSRGSASTPPAGPGFPEAARTPSPSATTRLRGSGAMSSADPALRFRSRPSEGGVAATPADPSRIEPRAVPRRVAPENWSGPPVEYRSVPTPASPSSDPPSYDRPGAYRAVPRSERPSADPSYAPSPTYGVQPERRGYRGPSNEQQDRSPRAIPRSVPDGGGPPPSYGRPSGGNERSAPPAMGRPAPSGPPPQSASPSRGSEQSSSSDGGGTRSRGDGQSTGRAVSRGRGGR